MPQSLSQVMIHLVFSTKNREPWIHDGWRSELHSYFAAIAKQLGSHLIFANSVADHIHLFIELGRTVTIADLVKKIKTASSKWIHRTRADVSDFAWQRGYGVFSVSPSHKAPLIQYIRKQADHHKTVTFQDEFRRLLAKYGVAYDEAYVWD